MTLTDLYTLILSRWEDAPEGSYTAELFAAGLPKIAQKVGEEAAETIVAALAQDDGRLIEEIADLTYHTLVLMAARGIRPEDITAELGRRHR